MKSIIRTLLLLLIMFFFVAPQESFGFETVFKKEMDGFKDLKWEMSTSQSKNFVPVSKNPWSFLSEDIKGYRRAGGWGSIKLGSETKMEFNFFFYKDRFYMAEARNYSRYSILVIQQLLLKSYGMPEDEDDMGMTWRLPNVVISAKCSGNFGVVHIIYFPIMKEIIKAGKLK